MKAKDCRLRQAVRESLAQLQTGSVGVVAVSGGPDSVALLRALVLEFPGPLTVAHLNHQLRGEESDADELFVCDLHARQLALGANVQAIKCQRMDVRSAAVGENLESTARKLRYDWLTQIARQAGASWVATGHTADDQAETVLHRLLRGTGLRGLAGIPSQRALTGDIALIRPLMGVRRTEVLAFLRQLGQDFREDSTNNDRRFTRSQLRHDLLPLLVKQYNPAIVEVLSRLAEQARAAQEYIESHAIQTLASAELPRAGTVVVLDTERLNCTAPILALEALRLLWQREGWPLAEMGYVDWQRIMSVAKGEQCARDLPGGVHIRRVGHVLQMQGPFL